MKEGNQLLLVAVNLHVGLPSQAKYFTANSVAQRVPTAAEGSNRCSEQP